MATKLMLKAFDLLEKIQTLKFRPKHLLNWNSSNNRFEYSRKFEKMLSWYLISSVGALEMTLFFAASFAMKFGYFGKDFTFIAKHYTDAACFSIYYHLVLGLSAWLEWHYYVHGQDLAKYINYLLTFQSCNRSQHQSSRKKLDIIGLMAYLVVPSITVACLSLEVIHGTGVLPSTIITITYKNIPALFTSPVLRAIQSVSLGLAHLSLFIVLVLEGASTVCIGFLVMLFANSALANHLHGIKYLFDSGQHSKSVRQYKLLLLIQQTGTQPFSLIIAIFMGVGFYIFIFSMVLSAFGWKLLSPLFFPLPPLTVGLCMVLLTFALPLVPHAINMSAMLIKNWKLHTFKFSNAPYVKKLLRSLPPLNIMCGQVGTLNAERSTTYIYSILDNSITALLLSKGILKAWNMA